MRSLLVLLLGSLSLALPAAGRADVHHSVAIGAGGAERHYALGGVDYQLTIDDFQIGAEVSLAAVESAYVQGLERHDGLRLWVRIPVQVPLVASRELADGREGLDARLVIAPSLRYLDAGELDAVALGGTVGAAAHVWLHPRVALGGGLFFPVLADTDGQVARFPGTTIALAVHGRVSPELAIGASAFASLTEGYNGDSEKQLFEAQLWARFFFDAEGRALPSLLPTAL